MPYDPVAMSRLLALFNAGNKQLGRTDITGPELAQRLAERRAMNQAQQPAQQPPGTIAARQQQLTAQGVPPTDAIAQMGREGSIDPRLARLLTLAPKAVPKY